MGAEGSVPNARSPNQEDSVDVINQDPQNFDVDQADMQDRYFSDLLIETETNNRKRKRADDCTVADFDFFGCCTGTRKTPRTIQELEE
jgi:hypothetical protein